MEEKINTIQPHSRFITLWMKFPVWLRAILLGAGVSTLGVGFWVLSVTLTPLYIAIPLTIIFIIFYIRYFSGTWPLDSTSQFRQMCFRFTGTGTVSMKWSLVASLFLLVFLNAMMVLTFRLTEFHPETFKTATFLTSMSPFLAWPLLILASVVAGVCEETGFRGYMQVPMERKYGVIIGITITGLAFVAVHLHQAWAGGILFQIFLAAIMIGLLAFATKSLVFGIVVHTLFDIVNFSYWWSDLAGTFLYKPVSITGIDLHFIATLIIFLGAALIFLAASRKLVLQNSNTAAKG